MAFVKDLWTQPGPNGRRIRGARWGIGKRWQARWIENGKQVSRTFETRDAAELHASRAAVGIADRTWITKDKYDITLTDMWEVWIASKASKASSTRAGYEAAWKHIEPTWGQTPCWKIERSKFSAWLPTCTRISGVEGGSRGKKLSPASLRKIGIVMKALLDQAVELDVITKNPLKSHDVPTQGPSTRRALTVREYDKLTKAAPTEQAELLIRVITMACLRPGEGKGLQVQDLDPDRCRLYIRRDVDQYGKPDATKNRKHRHTPIPQDLMWDLEDAAEGRSPEDWLCPDEYGNVWTEARWRRVWKTITQKAGLEGLTTHELRHTGISFAIAAGADIKAIQDLAGHADGATTLNRYGHLFTDGRDRIPGAMAAFLEAERNREHDREARRAQRAQERRGRFKIVD